MMTCKSYVFSAGSYSDNSLFFTVLGNHQNLIFDRMSNIFWFIRFTRQSDFSGIQWIQTKDCSAHLTSSGSDQAGHSYNLTFSYIKADIFEHVFTAKVFGFKNNISDWNFFLWINIVN